MKKMMNNVMTKTVGLKSKIVALLLDQKGEVSLELAIKILVTIVLSALILAGLYALIGDVVLPQIQQRVIEMFNFQG